MKEKDYTPTLKDVEPFINFVAMHYDTRKHWGAADSGYVKMAESLLGYPPLSVTFHSPRGDGSYELSYRDFLGNDFDTNFNGEFEDYDSESTCAILDWENTRNRIKQVAKISVALYDESLFLCRDSIVRAAEHAVAEVVRNERFDRMPSRTAFVQLPADKWERLCKFYEPEAYSGSPYRKFVHDPWVTAKAETAVALKVRALVCVNGDWTWHDGTCVFVPEGGIKYERDYPIDYWD